MPTVVDAATIVNDTMESLIHALDMEDYAQKYQLIKERIPSHLNTMFVTPKDIDETVKRLSYTISEAQSCPSACIMKKNTSYIAMNEVRA